MPGRVSWDTFSTHTFTNSSIWYVRCPRAATASGGYVPQCSRRCLQRLPLPNGPTVPNSNMCTFTTLVLFPRLVAGTIQDTCKDAWSAWMSWQPGFQPALKSDVYRIVHCMHDPLHASILVPYTFYYNSGPEAFRACSGDHTYCWACAPASVAGCERLREDARCSGGAHMRHPVRSRFIKRLLYMHALIWSHSKSNHLSVSPAQGHAASADELHPEGHCGPSPEGLGQRWSADHAQGGTRTGGWPPRTIPRGHKGRTGR